MITRIQDAPLPTVSPWAADPADLYRCPACALSNPGHPRCRRCGQQLVVQIKRRRPLTANLVNLLVVLLGRQPMLLIITLLYRPQDAPLITAWTIWMGVLVLPFWIVAGGLSLRWRWTWFLGFGLAGLDLLVMLALQIVIGGHPIIPIAAIGADLMIMGFLLTVFDEVRIDTEPLTFPPQQGLARTAIDAYNHGVRYSEAGLWYFAARMYERAAGFAHQEGRYRRALGGAYLRLGELAAAEAELRAAQALMPADPQLAQMLGVLHAAQQKATK